MTDQLQPIEKRFAPRELKGQISQMQRLNFPYGAPFNSEILAPERIPFKYVKLNRFEPDEIEFWHNGQSTEGDVAGRTPLINQLGVVNFEEKFSIDNLMNPNSKKEWTSGTSYTLHQSDEGNQVLVPLWRNINYGKNLDRRYKVNVHPLSSPLVS